MPRFDFRCAECERVIEVAYAFKDGPPVVKCDKCGKVMERVPAVPAIAFKGTGWYVTDYKGKE